MSSPPPPQPPPYNLALYLAGLLLIMAGLGGIIASACGAELFRDAWLLLLPGVGGIAWSIRRAIDFRRTREAFLTAISAKDA